MMKKRILASSMASVMALSSASVVAFADEAKKDYGEAVTKDELQAYVDSLESFVDDELDDYGYIQSEDFTEALDHANTVLEDSRAESVDYIAAYQMLKAVKDNLRIYTTAELKALVNEHKGAYNSENVLNKVLGDKIYKEEGYGEFADAYVDAEDSIESDDDRTITDAYMGLKRAAEKLENVPTVKKSEFRAALRAYEALEAKMADYEPWRRGTATVNPKSGGKEVKIADLKGKLTFGDLCYIVYTDDGSKNTVGVPTKTVTLEKDYFLGEKVARTGGLKETILEIYESLDKVEGAVETSEAKYINAYKAIDEAVKVFNSWTPDDTNNYTSETKADRVEDEYHGKLVDKFNKAQAEAIKAFMEDEDFEKDDKGNATFKVTIDDEKFTMKANKSFAVVVGADGKLACGPDVVDGLEDYIFTTKEDADAAAAAMGDTYKGESISMNEDIYDVLSYEVDDDVSVEDFVQAVTDAQTAVTNAETAVETAQTAVDAAEDAVEAAEEAVTEATTAVTDKIEELVVPTADATKNTSSAITEYDSTSYYHYTYTGANPGSAEETAVNTYNTGVDALKVLVDALGAKETALEEKEGELETKQTALSGAKATLKTKQDDLDEAEADLADAENTAAKYASLKKAVFDYRTYKDLEFTGDKKQSAIDEAEPIINALSEGGPQIKELSGRKDEWLLVGRKLAYTLDDVFPAPSKTDKTKEKLMALIEDSYTITDLTGDSAAFSASSFHIEVVNWRNAAYEFYKEAKAEGKKIDYDKFTGGPEDKNIDHYYDKLKKAKENLEKALAEFEYSYEEIRDAIGEYAAKVDAGEVKSDALVTAINKCAYDLTVLEASSFTDGGDVTNEAFDEDGVFLFANRLKTKKNDKIAKTAPNKLEKNLKASYEAMQKAYTDATAPAAGVKYDFDGDGKIGTSDLLVALNAVAGASTDTKFDANGDGKVSTSDLLIMLNEFAAQA